MQEIGTHEELVARCGTDTLCLWAARGLDGRSRAWRVYRGLGLRYQAVSAAAVPGAQSSCQS